MSLKKNLSLFALAVFVLGIIVTGMFSFAASGTPDFDITRTANKTTYVEGESGKLTYTITPKGQVQSPTRPSADIVLVIDVSTSMDGSKLTGLTSAAGDFITTIQNAANSDKIGLVTFGYKVNKTMALTTAYQTVKNYVTGLKSADLMSGTNYDDALKAAHRMLNASTAKSKFIIFFSDGQPNYFDSTVKIAKYNSNQWSYYENGIYYYTSWTGYDEPASYPPEAYSYPLAETKAAAEDGITTYAIGLGTNSEIDMGTLNSIAAAGGGKAYQSTIPNDLKAAFNSVSNAIVQSRLSNMRITEVIPSGLTVTPSDTVTVNGSTMEIKVPDIVFSSNQGTPPQVKVEVNVQFGSAGVYTFQNGKIAYSDINGTGTSKNISNLSVTVLDVTPPAAPQLSKSPTALTNGNVTVTAVYPGDASVKKYKIGSNGTYADYTGPIEVTSNNTVYAKCSDAAGNWSTETAITVDNIDKTPPTATITYSTTQPTAGNVVATLKPSETVTVTNNNGLFTRTFTENGTFTFEFRDAAGNTGTATATVSNIDKIPPTATIEYSTTQPTAGNVVATLKPSETVTVTNNSGLLTRTFTDNGTFTFEFKDAAGNTGTAVATVSNIDKIPPTATIEYSTTQPTAGNVVATLKPSETVTVTNNSGLLTYTFTANGTFTFEFKDAAGNTGTAKATVSNIDKIPPTATITYSTTQPTADNVVATLKPSETVTVTNNSGLFTRTFTENGTFTFEFKDAAGNTGTATATVNNIDRNPPNPPVITGVENGKIYISSVLPGWTDEAGTTSSATLNGASYTKGTAISNRGSYTLTVTAKKTLNGLTASTTVSFQLYSAPEVTIKVSDANGAKGDTYSVTAQNSNIRVDKINSGTTVLQGDSYADMSVKSENVDFFEYQFINSSTTPQDMPQTGWQSINLSGQTVNEDVVTDKSGYLNCRSYDVSHMPLLTDTAKWSNPDLVFKYPFEATSYKSATYASTPAQYGKWENYLKSDGTQGKRWSTNTVFMNNMDVSSVYGDYKEASKFWGYIKVPSDAKYVFGVYSDDGCKGYITADGVTKTFVNMFVPQSRTWGTTNENFNLKNDKYYPLYLEYFNWGGLADFELMYKANSDTTWKKVPTEWFYPSNNITPGEYTKTIFTGSQGVKFPVSGGDYYVAYRTGKDGTVTRTGLYGPFTVEEKTAVSVSKSLQNNPGNTVEKGTTFSLRYMIQPGDITPRSTFKNADGTYKSTISLTSGRIQDEFPVGMDILGVNGGGSILIDGQRITVNLPNITYRLTTKAGKPVYVADAVADVETILKANTMGSYMLSASNKSRLTFTDADGTTMRQLEFDPIWVNIVDTTAPDMPVLTKSPSKPTNGNVEVTATFPSDAVTKQYKIGENGDTKSYTGSITITDNNTWVYARCSDEAGNWSGWASILVDNIDRTKPDKPTLTKDPDGRTNGNVTVSADFPPDAYVKQYKIGDTGTVKDYTVPIVISTNNTWVYARCSDEAGNWSDWASILVDNINVEAVLDNLSINARNGVDKTTSVLKNKNFDAVIKYSVTQSGIAEITISCPEGSEELFSNLTTGSSVTASTNRQGAPQHTFNIVKAENGKSIKLTSTGFIDASSDIYVIKLTVNSGNTPFDTYYMKIEQNNDQLEVNVVSSPKLL